MRVELSGATGALSEYARHARRGKPVAILRTLTDQDWEDLVVSSNPAFLELMKRSLERFKPGSGISLDEIEREFMVVPKNAPRRRRPKVRRRRSR
jgi:hypothetical protein